jgi:hypothetical protein
VAEVEDIHQAEDQGQAGGDDEDDQAHGKAGQRQVEPGAGAAGEGQREQHDGCQ